MAPFDRTPPPTVYRPKYRVLNQRRKQIDNGEFTYLATPFGLRLFLHRSEILFGEPSEGRRLPLELDARHGSSLNVDLVLYGPLQRPQGTRESLKVSEFFKLVVRIHFEEI